MCHVNKLSFQHAASLNPQLCTFFIITRKSLYGLARTDFSPQTSHGVLARISLSPVCAESELCYIGDCAKLTPGQSAQTDSESVKISLDSVGLCTSPCGLAQNTWGRVKTSTKRERGAREKQEEPGSMQKLGSRSRLNKGRKS